MFSGLVRKPMNFAAASWFSLAIFFGMPTPAPPVGQTGEVSSGPPGRKPTPRSNLPAVVFCRPRSWERVPPARRRSSGSCCSRTAAWSGPTARPTARPRTGSRRTGRAVVGGVDLGGLERVAERDDRVGQEVAEPPHVGEHDDVGQLTTGLGGLELGGDLQLEPAVTTGEVGA